MMSDYYTLEKFTAALPADDEEPKAKPQGNGYDAGRPKTDFEQLNTDALNNLDAWVPKLFPAAVRRDGDKGWRVSSADLGRDLDEDLSFAPNGIKDFGVHDTGDPNGGRRTPINVVMEWKKYDFKAAVRWLCEALGRKSLFDADAPNVALDDFRAYMPEHAYIYLPTRELWPASSVNAQIPPVEIVDANGQPVLDEDGEPRVVKANVWLDQNRPVVQMTWAPGEPALITGRVVDQGGWVDESGVTIFNLYRAPTIAGGIAAEAWPWIDHVYRVYPDEADHIIRYFAHRVQRPHEKINHGLVLGGPPGIGKDTILEPVKRAVGPWNFAEVSPTQLLGRFNSFLKSVILRVSEARDLGDTNRFALYEHMKAYLAAPPDVLRCDEKHLREHSVLNVMGVVITSNRKDSFYLPDDDRRHYVAWTMVTPADFPDGYWQNIWDWYEAGGYAHVAAYLATLDISNFNPKAPPPKTAAFWEIVEANRTPENSELADAIEKLGDPDAVTIDMIKKAATFEFNEWLEDRRNARQIHHRLGECGYVVVRCQDRKDGLWRVDGKRQTIYANAQLSARDRQAAAMAFVKESAKN
jgi:hypothetical protein